MAATIEIPTTRPGETLTLSAFPDGSDTAAFTGETLTEASNRDGVYSYSNATATGLHLLVLYAGATPRWQAWAVMATDGTVVASDSRLEALYLDASVASRAAPGAEMDIVDAPNATAVTAIQDGLSTFDAAEDTVTLGADQAVNVTKVAGNSVAGVDDFKADVSSLATTEDLEAVDEIVDAIKAKTDELDFTGTSGMLKAEATNMRGTDGAVTSLSGIATEANATSNAGALAGLISGLNDLDATAVQDAAAAALTAYDPPTRAEATSDKEAVIAAIPASSANATAVRSELATELGRIDAAVSTRSSHNAADVWSVTTRTLSSFGTLVTDIATAVWSGTSRTLTAFGFAVGLSAQGKLDVNAEVDTALTEYGALKPTTPGRTLNVNEDGTADSTATVSEESIRDAIGLEDGDRVATPEDVQVSISPNIGTAPEPNEGVNITAYIGETIARTITVTDASGEPVSLEGKTLRIVVEDVNGTDVDVAEHEDIEISGADNNNATWTPQASTFSQECVLRLAIWSLSEETGDYVILPGTITVNDVARKDTT